MPGASTPRRLIQKACLAFKFVLLSLQLEVVLSVANSDLCSSGVVAVIVAAVAVVVVAVVAVVAVVETLCFECGIVFDRFRTPNLKLHQSLFIIKKNQTRTDLNRDN